MKIPIENLYYLLCYAWNKLEEKDIVDVRHIDFIEILDLFSIVLVNGVNHILKKGIDRNYIIISEETKRIKGKIDFNVSIKRNLIQKPVLFCHYDELSYDILHNQIIKSTILNLLSFDKIDKEIKEKLKSIYLKLSNISSIKIEKKHFRQIQLHSNNFFYDFLLKICEIIFDNTFIDEKSGKLKFRDFIGDEKQMAHLFEGFIRNFYKIELMHADVRREDLYWTDKDAQTSFLPKMQTDVSIIKNDKKYIIETKFYSELMVKHFGEEKLKSHNIYQIFSYLKNAEKKGGINKDCIGILLYPQVDKVINLNVKLENHQLYIRTINLNQTWKDIHNDLINLLEQ